MNTEKSKDSDMVTVHHFYTYDGVNDIPGISPTKWLAEDIEAIGHKIVPGTAEDVPRSALEKKLRYDPRKGSQS